MLSCKYDAETALIETQLTNINQTAEQTKNEWVYLRILGVSILVKTKTPFLRCRKNFKLIKTLAITWAIEQLP